MKLSKEDYMRLSKERLAELLVERDKLGFAPTWVNQPMQPTPCYAPDGICVNPQMDCINCPRRTTGDVNTSPNTATGISILKAEGK